MTSLKKLTVLYDSVVFTPALLNEIAAISDTILQIRKTQPTSYKVI